MKNIKIKYLADKKDIINTVELDKLCFEEDEQATVEIYTEWNKKNKNLFTLMYEDDKLIGYINFLPLTEECISLIRQGVKKDSDITKDDILNYEKHDTYTCLFVSLVVHPDYQNTNAMIRLLTAWRKHIEEEIIDRMNITIDSILVDCVNDKIKELVTRLDFKPIIKNNRMNIYEGDIF